jgi:predicted esterase
MSFTRKRAARRARAEIRSFLAVALGILSLLGTLVGAREARAAEPAFQWIRRDGATPESLVYVPSGDEAGPRPIAVMLHGMCGAPENECPAFASAFAKRGFLVCPRATLSCAGSGSTWSALGRAELVEAAIQSVQQRFPGRVDATQRTLVGFSLGAFVASELSSRDPASWPKVILLSAKIAPNVSRLAKLGAPRVLLGAGDFDLSKTHMLQLTRGLNRAGVEATFVSMGRVGHRFADDMDEWMDSALEWLARGAEPGA